MKSMVVPSRRIFLRKAAAISAMVVAAPAVLTRRSLSANNVNVGFVLPLTGPFAEAGQLQKAAVDLAIEEINAQGGVKCMGGAQLVPIYGSYQTDVAEANVETERLISNEGVVGIIGPYSSGVAIAGTEIAERAKIPYLVPNALSDEITSRGLKYTFKTVPNVSQFAIDSATLVRDLSKNTVVEPKTACLVRADDYFGNVVGEQFRNYLPKFDFEILSDNTYPNNATSMEDVILRLKGDDPDVVFASGEPAAITLLFQQLKELDYWPKHGWIGAGGGYSNPITHQNLGELGEGLIVINDWFPDINRPGAKEANERFKAKTGLDMLGNANTTYAGVWIFYYAIEAACSADPTKIRDALANLHLTEGVPMFMYPEVAFDEKGFMKFASNVGAQIKNGQAKVIWPSALAVTKAQWPVPGWDERV